MRKEDVKKMLQHYLSVTRTGKEPYFDADQIEDLLDYLESIEDFTYYNEVLALGLKLHPDNGDLLLKKCALYVYEEHYEKALQLLDSLIDADIDESNMIRLECYAAMKQYNKVVKFTRQLIDNRYDNLAELFENTATVLNDEEMYNEALNYIKWGLTLYPDSQQLKEELCFTLEHLGNLEQAIQVCNNLIDESPYSYQDWVTLGHLYCTAQLFDKAIDAFDFALTCNDKDEEVYLLKGYCLYRNESYEKALSVYNELLEISHNEALASEVWPLISSCYIKLEEFEKGYNLLKKLIDEKNEMLEASTYIDFVRCCMELDHKKEAQETLRFASLLYPHNTHILSLYILAMIEMGDYIATYNYIQKLIGILQSDDFKGNQEDVDSFMLIGKFLFLIGRCKEAVIFYKKVEELNPHQKFINVYLCMAYNQLHDEENYNKYFKKSAEKEVFDYMKEFCVTDAPKDIIDECLTPINAKDLTHIYLNNKDNYN